VEKRRVGEGKQEKPIAFSPNLDHSPIKSQESEVNTDDLDLISPRDKVKPKSKPKASLRQEVDCKKVLKKEESEVTDLDDYSSENEEDQDVEDDSSEETYSLDSDLERLPNIDNSDGKVGKVEEWIKKVKVPRNPEKEYLSHQDTARGLYRVPYKLDANLTTKKLTSNSKLNANGMRISDNYNGGPPYAVVKIEPLDMPPLAEPEGVEAQ